MFNPVYLYNFSTIYLDMGPQLHFDYGNVIFKLRSGTRGQGPLGEIHELADAWKKKDPQVDGVVTTVGRIIAKASSAASWVSQKPQTNGSSDPDADFKLLRTELENEGAGDLADRIEAETHKNIRKLAAMELIRMYDECGQLTPQMVRDLRDIATIPCDRGEEGELAQAILDELEKQGRMKNGHLSTAP